LPGDAALEKRIRRQIDELLAEDAEVEALIRDRNPLYKAVADPSFVTADEVQASLLEDQDVLIEYSLGEARSFVWIISKQSARIVELAPRPQIERDAQRLLTLLGAFRDRKSDPAKQAYFRTALRTFSRSIHLELDGATLPSRVIVIPDGILNKFPFDILPVRSGIGPASQDLQPLGLCCEVIQAPSASVFKMLKERQAKAAGVGRGAVAFADPVFDSLDPRVKHQTASGTPSSPTRSKTAGINLARLPYSQIEVETIEQFVPPAKRWVLRGFQANKSTFLNHRLEDYPVLLLSTHAFADDRQPELSSIVLSMVDERGLAIDGLVHVYDLYDLTLGPALVILSACESASGREVRGEGIIGLSRGFLFAGASGILVSPLKIDAEGSAFLISAFLRELLGPARLPPSKALLEARKTLARSARWKDPYYWGSFVLTSGFQ